MSMLTENLKYLKGVSEKKADVLAENGLNTYHDLLHHFPRRYLDRSTISMVRSLVVDQEVTVMGTVRVQNMAKGRRPRFEVLIEDSSGGQLKGVWFNGVSWISRMFSLGERVTFHGKVQRFGNALSIFHPDFDKLDSEGPSLDTGRILALYPGNATFQRMGLTSRTFRRLVHHLIKTRGLEIPHILPDWMQQEYNLLDGRVALRAIHFPRSQTELDRARHRLKFEELFFMQLLLAQRRLHLQKKPGNAFDGPGKTYNRFLQEILPFDLTGAQQRVLRDITHDMMSGNQMNRLIQGDVGSGKTVVAAAALLFAIDNGYQGAFMAPTEILAEQHFATLKKFLDPLGLNVRLLIGGQRKKLRQEILGAIAAGYTHVVIGTHAIIQDTVVFRKLGLAVIDEQHRFGVMQRARLLEKGDNPHILLMTATPIPRSLALTQYGDLEKSIIDELPKGRKPVLTKMFFEKRREDMLTLLHRELQRGHQAYIVYPLIEESEKMDLKDAEKGFRILQQEFSDHTLDLVHGQMSSAQKDEAMQRFNSGITNILVATTVIEVGVDTPNATVMVIEHAERFGLSQLHQLRGRVGRGTAQSHCILMADYRRSHEAIKRLAIMEETTDGFEISNRDLKIRGAGDFFGTRQSGLPDLKIADLAEDGDILDIAQKATEQLLRRDPDMQTEEHTNLRTYYEKLYLTRGDRLSRVG